MPRESDYIITGCKHCDGWHRDEPCPFLPVGTEVRWGTYDATVRSVERNGSLLLNWAGPWPMPFFTGPYHPNELEVR